MCNHSKLAILKLCKLMVRLSRHMTPSMKIVEKCTQTSVQGDQITKTKYILLFEKKSADFKLFSQTNTGCSEAECVFLDGL